MSFLEKGVQASSSTYEQLRSQVDISFVNEFIPIIGRRRGHRQLPRVVNSKPGDIYFRLKVHASAKEERLHSIGPDRFEVWVREPAEGGRANRAVLALLSKSVGVPAGRLWIVKGAHTSSKIIALKRAFDK